MIVGRLLYIHLQASLPDCVLEMFCGAENSYKKVTIDVYIFFILTNGVIKYHQERLFIHVWVQRVQSDFMFMSLNVATEENNIVKM